LKHLIAVRLDEGRIAATDSPLPPFDRTKELVKVREILATPVNFLCQERRGLLGLVRGRLISSGEEIVSTNFCEAHGHYDKSVLGWSLTPVSKSSLVQVPEEAELGILAPLFSLALDAAEKSAGETLVISKGGLTYALYSSAALTKYYVFAGEHAHRFKNEPLVSPEKLKGSSWDTVLVLTIDRALVLNALDLLISAKNFVFTPLFSCAYDSFPVKCSACRVLTLSPSERVEVGDLRRLPRHVVYKYLDVVSVGELPFETRKSYAIVALQQRESSQNVI